MIELTVAMPLYNSKYIAWLAMESLCRQKNVTFDWELIVSEEQNVEMYGEETINNFKPRLVQSGCRRVTYIPVQEKIWLIKKLRDMSLRTDKHSNIFVFQAGDCYSQPFRLIETYDLMKSRDYNFISSQVGPFYNIKTGELVIYDHQVNPLVNGLSMAIKTSLMKQIRDYNKPSGIDSWIVRELKRITNRNLNYGYNKSENWKYGLDTHGLNNISKARSIRMRERTEIFKTTDMKIEDIIPSDILIKLNECKQYCRSFA